MSGRISHIVIRAFVIMLMSVTVAAVAVAVEPADRHEAPSAVVRAYLQAVREGNYDQTYNYLSSKRRNGMSRKDWVEQFKRQAVKLRSKVLLMRVEPAFVRGEEATVVTSFRLKTPEGTKVSRETYNLVREEGRWRIDGTKVFDPPAEK